VRRHATPHHRRAGRRPRSYPTPTECLRRGRCRL